MKGDPYWTTARRPDSCGDCRDPIKPGDRMFYYPSTRRAYCAKDGCGGKASRDFHAHAADDAFCCW